MIPKIIHYCWFGNSQKNEKVKKCLQTIKDKLNDYEIIEWNESNFDLSINSFARQAYQAKKYAYTSDFVRVYVLEKYGGIYIDTDVEILKSFNDLLDKRCVFGFESGNFIATSFMAAEPHHPIIKQFVNLYDQHEFYTDDGNFNLTTNVKLLTKMLQENGLELNNKYQVLNNGIEIFPSEYFSPYDYRFYIYEVTNKSYCVHHFYVSWLPMTSKMKKYLKKIICKIIGKNNMIRFYRRQK